MRANENAATIVRGRYDLTSRWIPALALQQRFQQSWYSDQPRAQFERRSNLPWYSKTVLDFRKLSMHNMKSRRAKANYEPFHKFIPCGNTSVRFKPIVPLYCFPFEIDRSNFHLLILGNSVEAEETLCTWDPASQVTAIPMYVETQFSFEALLDLGRNHSRQKFGNGGFPPVGQLPQRPSFHHLCGSSMMSALPFMDLTGQMWSLFDPYLNG